MGLQTDQRSTTAPPFAPGPLFNTDAMRYGSEGAAAEVAAILSAKSRAFLKVSGKSMLPWIRPRDVVFVRRSEISAISRGDVVVFERDGRLCIHRVISTRVSGNDARSTVALITKGDSVAAADEPVFAEHLRGKVEFLYRRGREIRLDSACRKMFGKLLAKISPASRFWLPDFCRLKNHWPLASTASYEAKELITPAAGPHRIPR